VPVEVFTKLTVSGEQPDVTLGVKLATSCAFTEKELASKKNNANTQFAFPPEYRVGNIYGFLDIEY